MDTGYHFSGGDFVLEDYANKSAFCDFLPGIAGLTGRPVWAFYINRGQGIAGFGVRDKNSPIMEFFPAEIAYSDAPRKGFRTFLRIDGNYCEPFEICSSEERTCMRVMRHGFSLDENRCGKYAVHVEFFGVPSQDYAALGRIVTYTNRSEHEQDVEFLDGLAQVLPYGLTNTQFKDVGNLFKSWMCVEGAEEGFGFYRMRSSTADSAEVSEITAGNFSVSASDKAAVRMVVDPKIVFGEERTRTKALAFAKNGLTDEAYEGQNTENEFACAFAHGRLRVPVGGSFTVVQLIGFADDISRVQRLKGELSPDMVYDLRDEARRICEGIVARADCATAYPLFDEYVRQSYFDNVLRGGMPVNVGDKTYYVYSRKHGDPERDYNFFVIEPQPYSCGNGNFRDVVQNRRNDPFFTPECGDFNLRYFFSLVQADGYNPLSVLGVRFTAKGDIPQAYSARAEFLRGKFTLGELCEAFRTTDADTLSELLSFCEPVCEAAFSEGYWTDHFVYLGDLLTSYLAVYPERAEEVLYRTPYRYFASGAQVLPRTRTAVLRADGQVRRYGSIVHGGKDGWLTAENGEVFETSLAAKLVTLVMTKMATLDPCGCGIDMEGGKPGWNDATNGLPALFGSNIADALELKRLIVMLRSVLSEKNAVVWSAEQSEFFRGMLALERSAPDAAAYYEASNDLKEAYRVRVYTHFTGACAEERGADVLRYLSLAEARLSDGLARAEALGDGWYPTYLRFDAAAYEPVTEGGKAVCTAEGLPYVRVTKFVPHALPHFAEGVAKGLMLGEKQLYARARNSALYDETLGVYRSSEPLDGESMEIGRIRSFPKGWLERESCFLHMNYKLMLSILEAGLYEEFYREIGRNFVPFMDPAVYGRSTLENSSFLATSNHCDKTKWGKGFQARLTGANAEVLSMWLKMTGADRPFTVQDGALRFALSPVLKGDFFREDGTLSFTLFGRTRVVYRNPARKNTWEARVGAYKLIAKEGEQCVQEVRGALAEEVRAGKFETIEVDII